MSTQQTIIKLASRPAIEKIQEMFMMEPSEFIPIANETAVLASSIMDEEGEYLYAVIWQKAEKRYWQPYILVIAKEHQTLVTVVTLTKTEDLGATVYVAKHDLKNGVPKALPRQYIKAAAEKKGIEIPLWIDQVFYPEAAAPSESRGGEAPKVDVTLSVQYKSQFRLFTGGKGIPAARPDKISACIQRAIDRAKKKETPEDPITHMTGRVKVKSTGEVIMEEVLLGDTII